MNNLNRDPRILKSRAEFYKCSLDTFSVKGTTFRILDSFTGTGSLYHTILDKHTFITAGQDLADFIRSRTDCSGTSLSLKDLEGLFRSFRKEMGYPHYFYLKNQTDHLPSFPLPSAYTLKRVSNTDHKTLQVFLDRCTAEDIEEALIDLDDPDEEIRLIYRDDIPVAYAGYRPVEADLGDVGILVHPDFRKKGLGAAAVAEVTRACLANESLPYYRTADYNRGSSAIALKCGYEYAWSTTECKVII